jgi:hypothetical protein
MRGGYCGRGAGNPKRVCSAHSQTVSNVEGVNGSLVTGRGRETKSQLRQGTHLHDNQMAGTYTSAPNVESEAGRVT